jgi:hypothetical protein
MKTTEKQKETIVEDKTTDSKKVSSFKYKLVRKKDNLVVEANEVCYIFWKGNGTFQSIGNFPKETASLALDLEYGVTSTHITDQITKILEITHSIVKFETKDGVHELTINK